MIRTTSAAVALSLCILSVARAADGDGFVPLFNGKNLDGWVNVNCAPSTWTIEDGMLICSGVPIGELRTTKMYENFILEAEWRHMKPKGNAGIFVWADAMIAKGTPFIRGVEVQVLENAYGEGPGFTTHGDIFPIHGAIMRPLTGKNVGKASARAFPTEHVSNPSPQWNHYRIECNNGNITLAVNGKVVTKGADASPRKGYICLESEGGLVHWRNVRIKELPASDDLKPEHIAKADEGFKSLYNGVDFTGWVYPDGHKGHWVARDWVLNYDGQSEAQDKNLWTEKEYGDFELIVDWRWTDKPQKAQRPIIKPNGDYELDDEGKQKTVEVDDAGDSGIYLRGSSKSQVNMWCWPVGSGEVYGYRNDKSQPAEVRAGVTPKVNADAKIGGWNRFHITMKGDRLTVVLNGKMVIENAQLPGVKERGRIALQHHGNPIQFANIFIKELD